MMAAALFALVLGCYFAATGAQQNGDVKLVSEGHDPSIGRLEIFLDRQWGTVRFNKHSDQSGVGQAVCRQLGYYDVLRNGTVHDLNLPEADTAVPTLLAKMNCTYNSYPPNGPQHILRCQYERESDSSGNHEDDMAVQCDSYTWSYGGDVKLSGGKTGYKSSGYVEIDFYDGYGAVCNMGQYDADSACRQLGYTNAVNVTSGDGYTGTSRVDEFKCSRSYPCLYRCFNTPAEDASISCPQHSYITCTFDESSKSENSAGNELLCEFGALLRDLMTIIIGVTVGSLLLLVIACVGLCLCCCLIPGCLLYSTRSRGSYKVINA